MQSALNGALGGGEGERAKFDFNGDVPIADLLATLERLSVSLAGDVAIGAGPSSR